MRLKLKFWHKKFTTTPRGAAILQYIIDKYFNADYGDNYIIQPYEDMINSKSERVEQFARLSLPGVKFNEMSKEEYNNFIHISSAMFYFIAVMHTQRDQDMWMNKIKSDEIKRTINSFLNVI